MKRRVAVSAYVGSHESQSGRNRRRPPRSDSTRSLPSLGGEPFCPDPSRPLPAGIVAHLAQSTPIRGHPNSHLLDDTHQIPVQRDTPAQPAFATPREHDPRSHLGVVLRTSAGAATSRPAQRARGRWCTGSRKASRKPPPGFELGCCWRLGSTNESYEQTLSRNGASAREPKQAPRDPPEEASGALPLSRFAKQPRRPALAFGSLSWSLRRPTMD